MKKTIFLIATLVFSLYLTGCTKSNVNDNVAYQNRNGTGTTRVNYNNPNHVGPAITGVDNTNPNTGLNGNINGNNVGNYNNSRMRVADKAAKKVADLPEVDTANIIVTKNNAYVAAKLNSSTTKLTSAIKSKISRKVKSVDHDIDHVYISVNPDFYDRINTYAGDIRNGRPISGFFNEFTQTIQRVFPNAK
jgi:YhcN/YlaJ family sporulation lipoprotein